MAGSEAGMRRTLGHRSFSQAGTCLSEQASSR
jgi:hypothetical protein